MHAPQVSAHDIRQVLAGLLDVSSLPWEMRGPLLSLMRKMERQRIRSEKREVKALQHQAAGLNGPRAVARRLRQIEAGSLRVSL